MKKILFASTAMLMVMALAFTSCKKDPIPERPIPPEVGESELKGKLFINEVNGWPSDDPGKNFELWNSTNQPISLAGFSVLYEGDRLTWTGFSEDEIPANGYFVIRFARIDDGRNASHPDAGPRKPGGLGFSTGLSANNPGIYLTLLDADGDLVDHYEKLTEIQSSDPLFGSCHARIPDGGTWYFIPDRKSVV